MITSLFKRTHDWASSAIMWALVVLIGCIPLREVRWKLFPRFFSWQKGVFEKAVSFPVMIPKFIGHQGVLHVTELLFLMMGTYLLIRRKHQLKSLVQGPARYLTLFVCVALISIGTSSCSQFFFPYFTALTLFTLVMGFDQIATFFKEKPLFASLAIGSFILIGCFEGVVATFQFLFQKSAGLRLFGEHKLYIDKDPLVASFPLTSSIRTFLDLFHRVPDVREQVLRAYGTMNYPNSLSGFLLVSSTITLGQWLRPTLRLKKWVVATAFIVQLIGLLFSFSRGGLIGFFIAATALITCHTLQLNLSFKELIRRYKKVWPLSFLGLCTLCLALMPFYQSRGGLLSKNKMIKEGNAYRLLYQDQAIKVTKHKPLIGHGYGCFTFFPAPFLADSEDVTLTHLEDFTVTRDRPHNIFLLISAETGLLGLALFLSFFGVIFIKSFFYRQTLTHPSFVCSLLGLMFVGLVDIYLLSDFEGRLLLITCAALAWGTILQTSMQPNSLAKKTL